MTPDKICAANADAGTKLSVKLLPDDEGFHPLAVVRGNRAAMLFLADLLRAVAEQEPGYDMSLAPDGAGSALFGPDSNLGLYVDLTD